MVRYWSSFTPLVVILTVALLTLPWLGLIALMLLALVVVAALGGLAWGAVFMPRMLVLAVGRRLPSRSGTRRRPARTAVLLASKPSKPERLT